MRPRYPFFLAFLLKTSCFYSTSAVVKVINRNHKKFLQVIQSVGAQSCFWFHLKQVSTRFLPLVSHRINLFLQVLFYKGTKVTFKYMSLHLFKTGICVFVTKCFTWYIIYPFVIWWHQKQLTVLSRSHICDPQMFYLTPSVGGAFKGQPSKLKPQRDMREAWTTNLWDLR